MFYILMFVLSLSAFSIAEEPDEVALIITNYQYDRWGRPSGRTVQRQPGIYYNPNNNSQYYNNNSQYYNNNSQYYNNNSPYYNSPYYNYPYYNYPGSLPGADPDRFEDIFEQNSRK